jgi:MFS family permease
MPTTGPDSPQRQLLRNRAFVRLWIAGICSNSMRWLEILASSLYVFAATGSALAVAVVTMMRAVPMLAAGALAGVVAEGMNRKHLLHFGQALNAATSAIIVLAALTGRLEIWLLALGSLANGLVWATEMAVRRRMAGEAAGEHLVAPAIAIDSMSNSITRMMGPILGGLAYEMVGIAGAYAIGMAGYTLGLLSCLRLDYSQTVQPIRLRAVPGAISEAARICRGHAVLRRIIVLTTVMNVFGFSYTTVFPAWGQQVFGASPAMIGLLAGAEPLGALFGAWLIATRKLPVAAATLFLGGSTMFMALLAVAANLPVFALAWILLAVGGLGTAAFGSMQTALVILNVHPAARSRVLGLVTTSIGLGPLGVLAIGALSDAIGPPAALTVMGGIGAVLAIAMRGAPER